MLDNKASARYTDMSLAEIKGNRKKFWLDIEVDLGSAAAEMRCIHIASRALWKPPWWAPPSTTIALQVAIIR